MAADPIIPPTGTEDPPRRIFADQVDRGNGVADMQGVRLWGRQIGDDDYLRFLDVEELFAFITDGSPNPSTLHAMPVLPQTFSVGDFGGDIAGQTSTPYAAGDQVGDPAQLTVLGGTAIPAGAQIALRNLGVVIADLGKQLDIDARVWIVNDNGGGVGDAGDNQPADFTLPALATALSIADDHAIAELASANVLQFRSQGVTLIGPQSYLVVQAGSLATWLAADQLSFVWGGELAGVGRA